MLNFRQGMDVFWEAEGAGHSANAETVLEVIKSLKGDTDPEKTPTLVTSEVACWMIWGYPYSRTSPERKSEHFWDHVDCSDRL